MRGPVSAEPRTKHASADAIRSVFSFADKIDGFGPDGQRFVLNNLNMTFFHHNFGVFTTHGFSFTNDSSCDQAVSLVYDAQHASCAVDALKCLEDIGAVVRAWAPEPCDCAPGFKCLHIELKVPDVG